MDKIYGKPLDELYRYPSKDAMDVIGRSIGCRLELSVQEIAEIDDVCKTCDQLTGEWRYCKRVHSDSHIFKVNKCEILRKKFNIESYGSKDKDSKK